MLAGTKATLYLILYISMFSISCSSWAPKDLALRYSPCCNLKVNRILDTKNKT